MKPAPFAYHAPRSRDALFALLAERGDARLLAGGQSLVPLLNLRLAGPANLIDLQSVPGLDGIEIDHGVLRIGAMTRQRIAEHSAVVAQICPLLSEALHNVGFQQTRNRGTIGGSIAHMDPTAELPVVASATGATLVLESQRGSRLMPFADWSAGYLATTIAPDEVLTRIDFPCWPAGHGWAFEEVTRRGEGFAMVAVAALAMCDSAGHVTQAAIAIGGLGAAPQLVAAAEAALVGNRPTVELIAAAGAASAELPADGDLYAPADYKRHLARVLTERTLRLALSRVRVVDHV
jgi:carbon-monoxide dehydrogenase medium subunit